MSGDANLAAYETALRHYERQLALVEERADREWLAYISGRTDLRYRTKTRNRRRYLEAMIARIKYVHIPAVSRDASNKSTEA